VVGKIKTRQKEVGFQVMVGSADKLHASLDAGAVGGVLAFACLAPTSCYEIYTAWKEGDAALAVLKQERISSVSRRVIGDFGISGVKYAMDLNGYFGGPARLPLLPLTGEAKAQLEQILPDIKH
jgi:4-hydroxy-2-oxoglutarate aldolase